MSDLCTDSFRLRRALFIVFFPPVFKGYSKASRRLLKNAPSNLIPRKVSNDFIFVSNQIFHYLLSYAK